MPKLIKDGAIIEDSWTLLGKDADTLPDGQVIVPYALWQAHRETLLASGQPLAVWLDSDQPPALIADDLPRLALVALNFPKFADGRAYSYARLLRERHGYQGEVRAIGDVLCDQMCYMQRCGFNAFAVRQDKHLETALASLEDFRDAYQPTVQQPLPHFRRIALA